MWRLVTVGGSLKAAGQFKADCLTIAGETKSPKAPSIVNMTTEEFKRLPANVLPVHYELELRPDLMSFEFAGVVKIHVQVTEGCDRIQLNTAELKVLNVWWQDDAIKIENLPFHLNEDQELMTVKFERSLILGTGVLGIHFIGTLNDRMKGFYRSKFTTPSGHEIYNAVTQFAPTDARRAFPCWDEPALKATFVVTIVAPKGKVALSNMPVKEVVADAVSPDHLVYTYDRTPKMSTYLLAFVVGEFDYVEDTDSDGVLCRVYTPPGKKEQGKFALDVTVKVLPFYKEYFGIAYPLPKMDLIAISDFVFGAMENWGLVTYRETRLLVDETQTSTRNKQAVAAVVGHEMAHQWFGNLVTMDWWTNLWLNEGYASFVQYLCVDHIFPEYDIWTQFVTETLNGAFRLDALSSSHPIEVPINHPCEINEIFDAISYLKGASIIRMLHDFIGSEDFKKGMNLYLTRYQYSSATTEDLWKALEDASRKPVGLVMSSWTKQMGFPLVSVSRKNCDGGAIVHMRQEKYQLEGSIVGNLGAKWAIPLNIASERTGGKLTVLMDKEELEVKLDSLSENSWILVNPGLLGFFKVNYSSEMLQPLLPLIRNKTLPQLDRLGILEDLFSLVLAGKRSTVEVLKLLEAYIEEDTRTVWTSISGIFSRLQLVLDGTPCLPAFKQFGRRLFANIFKKTGWRAKSDETHLDALLRCTVVEKMVSLGDLELLTEAQQLFKASLEGSQEIEADLKTAIYRSALVLGGEEAYRCILDIYRSSDNLEEKDRIGRNLGATTNPELLQDALKFSLSDDVRSQDTIFIVAGVSSSLIGRDLAWNFFKENVDVFKAKYQGGPLAPRMLKAVLENYADVSKIEDITKFFSDNPFPGTEMAIKQACESIVGNAKLLDNDLEKISSFFSG